MGEFAEVRTLEAILNKLKVDKIGLCPGGGSEGKTTYIRPKIKENFLTTNPKILFLSNKFLRRKAGTLMDREYGNTLVHELQRKLPKRIVQYYWVNFFEPDFYDKLLKKYREWKFQGLKLHQCIVPFKNDGKAFQLLSEFAAEQGLPIFIHIYSAREAKKLVQTALHQPETNYILAHFMGLEETIRFAPKIKNIYFDTSTYYIVSEKRIRKAIKYFGADHVIMGSDSPFGINNLERIIKKIRGLKIPPEERAAILGGAAAQLLKLT
ncbi:MAG: amidohydrolase family protein [Candidatus Heimdallarchaeota archaeon]|nr:amidohydrolase family protein [Candidatus Heimdallarchaeota archaeon]